MTEPDNAKPNSPQGCKRGTIERARELCTFASWHREQMEGELQELCEFFGTHPDDDTLERDWCVDVIYNGIPLDLLLANVERLRKAEQAAKESLQ